MTQNIIIIITISVITFLAIKTGFVKMAAKFVIEIFAKWTARVVVLMIFIIVLTIIAQIFNK